MARSSVLWLLAILAYSNGAVVMDREDSNGTYGIHKAFSSASDTLPTPYIYRGEDAEVGAFPWTVRLMLWKTRTRFSRCGGSLISDRHVLTAAHCMAFNLTHYHNVKIYLGEYNTTSYGKDCAKGKCVYNRLVYPDKIIRHPQYDSAGNTNNDIALLRLEQRIRATPSIQPIPLIPFDVDTPEFVGHELVALGWGILNEQQDLPEVLQAAVIRLAPKSECRYRVNPNVPPSSFCTRSAITAATCIGDSGGPAVMYYRNKYYLAGITSMGPDCSISEDLVTGYLTFTNVFRHLKWIKTHMK